jgi:hypothetical protein
VAVLEDKEDDLHRVMMKIFRTRLDGVEWGITASKVQAEVAGQVFVDGRRVCTRL